LTAVLALMGAVHSAGGWIQREGAEIRLTAPRPLPHDLLAQLRAAQPDLLAHLHEATAEPAVILRDGRRLYRFPAETQIPRRPPRHLLPLIEHARS
jgi:hypothetical protein